MVQPTQPVLAKESFNPEKHLQYSPPSKIHSMEELGFADNHGVSPVAVSEPFPLFTQEAVMRFREEILKKEVIDNCSVSSNISHCQLRGYASKYAPFVYDAWKNPEVLRIVSNIAGVELTPAMDFEIAHVNLSVQSPEQMDEELRAYQEESEKNDDDKDPIVGWHTDSYPFVCVTMLSDCTQMIGGETALRTGTGEIMKVRGPQMGCAVVLQGRYIEHQALRALGGLERISMVTSFRPKNPLIKDDTCLTTVRGISDLKELYSQFSEYRLEILEERIRAELKEIRESRAAGRGVSTRKLKAFLEEQQRFLEHMNCEMVDEDKVAVGIV
ncbi:hypothetical protein M406DRAFT_261979 [Cryphonectria parasitica EP155]|uniref:Fe2OG dioxygenase domain-containing protein n=1 Tax=Cryphonectria parasitica (strain ATCC 38755 / EP155) TaxID=660469 RepID=A0A9P5CMI4_CRYP1|nr:uncharacterized protein M406DRAFT_261979 [Cryphonectria parasitica EP155]KAF3763292.1 hypothetical protein M406DRAFT_261979 [Cryphonectria parasitica EP155]